MPGSSGAEVRIPTRGEKLTESLLVLLLLFGVSAAAAAAQTRAAESPSRHRSAEAAFPNPELIRLDNPSRAAIVRHDIEAAIDPSTNGLEVHDAMTVVHAPGTPAEQPFSFLLWKGLDLPPASVSAWLPVPSAGARPADVSRERSRPEAGRSFPLRCEVRQAMTPRSFWRRPPYEELDGYENTRQIDLVPNGPGAVWPETLTVELRFSGTVMDSLRPPKAAYARSFETTAGLITDQGAFLAGSTFWVPSRPDEVFTFACRASVPAGWRAVCQGGLVEAAAGAGGSRRADAWDCPHPMNEVYLVAGPWTLHERDHGGVAVQTFTYAGTDSVLYTRYLDGTGRYLDLYGGLIGPYPFAKFALVENFWQTGFGMPSFTLLGDRVIRLPFILDTSYGHEILHNWWGNGVFVDAERGNWCEGLTTYGADYLYKEREGPEAARQYRLNALSGYLDYVSGGEDIPLGRFRERHDFATQAIGYSKSMMVIHQLRRRVGEALFWEALRAFYRQNLWRRASWSDLLDSFQAVAEVDPAPFLRQWIERSGAPEIRLSDVTCRAEGKRWAVGAKLSQALPDVEREGGPFEVAVPVRVRWESGDSTFQVPLDSWERTWSVVVDRPPIRLEVDPDFEMMRRIGREEIPPTLSRVLGSDTVTVVIASGLSPELEQAYRDLAVEWAKGQALAVVAEADRPESWIPPTSTWYLGLGRAARALVGALPEARAEATRPARVGAAADGSRGEPGVALVWNIAEKEYAGSSSVVVAGSFPGHPERAWALIAVPDPKQVRTIGDKVPHYGKYSYLIFRDGKNVGQGVWTQTGSPLTIDLAARGNDEK